MDMWWLFVLLGGIGSIGNQKREGPSLFTIFFSILIVVGMGGVFLGFFDLPTRTWEKVIVDGKEQLVCVTEDPSPGYQIGSVDKWMEPSDNFLVDFGKHILLITGAILITFTLIVILHKLID
jgi:hypothetical protein